MRRPTGLATRIIMSNAWQDPEVPARSATHQTDSSIMAKLLKIAKTKDVPPGQAAACSHEAGEVHRAGLLAASPFLPDSKPAVC